MLATTDFSVTKVKQSRLQDLNLEKLPFGRYFTDHMLEADFDGGEWKQVEIKPYGPMLMSPSASVLPYGQAIFEGIKAFNN